MVPVSLLVLGPAGLLLLTLALAGEAALWLLGVVGVLVLSDLSICKSYAVYSQALPIHLQEGEHTAVKCHPLPCFDIQVFLAKRKLLRWCRPSPLLSFSLSGFLSSAYCVPTPCVKCCYLTTLPHFITMATLLCGHYFRQGETEAQKSSVPVYVQTASRW